MELIFNSKYYFIDIHVTTMFCYNKILFIGCITRNAPEIYTYIHMYITREPLPYKARAVGNHGAIISMAYTYLYIQYGVDRIHRTANYVSFHSTRQRFGQAKRKINYTIRLVIRVHALRFKIVT